MEYTAYINSAAWKAKRLERLAIDKGRCRMCGDYPERPQVHHSHYDNFGNENVVEDLITVCQECHDACTDIMRRKRFQTKSIELMDSVVISTIRVRKEEKNEDIEYHDYRDTRPAYAQRPDRRSSELLLQEDEGDQQQAKEGGC